MIMLFGLTSWIVNMITYSLGNSVSPPNAPSFSSSFAKLWILIKPLIWLNVINPNCTSVLNNPWCFEIPINFKPTFINVDLLDSNIHLADSTDDSNLNFSPNTRHLSNRIDSLIRNSSRIDPDRQKSWVILVSSKCYSIISAIYILLNDSNFSNYSWQGWKNMWKLNTPPRSKFFIWTLLHEKSKP